MARAKQTIDEKRLSHWNLLDEFRRRLAKVMESAEPKQKSPGGPERRQGQSRLTSIGWRFL